MEDEFGFCFFNPRTIKDHHELFHALLFNHKGLEIYFKQVTIFNTYETRLNSALLDCRIKARDLLFDDLSCSGLHFNCGLDHFRKNS